MHVHVIIIRVEVHNVGVYSDGRGLTNIGVVIVILRGGKAKVMKRSSRRASLSQSSDSAKRSVDYKAKYEKLLTETLMDYESTVRTAQQRAEKFTKGET